MVGTLLALFACSSASSDAPGTPASTPAAPAPAAAPPVGSGAASAASGVLEGVCEASAILPWQGGWLVGDNEDTRSLHAYGPDFTPRGPVALPVEVDDVEALALRDGAWLVVGSHSTNKEGKARPARERIVTPEGRSLTADVTACPRCVALRGSAPDAGGFNIEGAAWLDGTLWLGLRGPLSEGGAALLLAADADARVTRVVEVDLGGQGIRDLAVHDGGLLLVGGPVNDRDTGHSLWRLASPDAAPERLAVELPPSTEGIAVDPAAPGRLVYVTDGDGKPGKPCKAPAAWGVTTLPGW